MDKCGPGLFTDMVTGAFRPLEYMCIVNKEGMKRLRIPNQRSKQQFPILLSFVHYKSSTMRKRRADSERS